MPIVIYCQVLLMSDSNSPVIKSKYMQVKLIIFPVWNINCLGTNLKHFLTNLESAWLFFFKQLYPPKKPINRPFVWATVFKYCN